MADRTDKCEARYVHDDPWYSVPCHKPGGHRGAHAFTWGPVVHRCPPKGYADGKDFDFDALRRGKRRIGLERLPRWQGGTVAPKTRNSPVKTLHGAKLDFLRHPRHLATWTAPPHTCSKKPEVVYD